MLHSHSLHQIRMLSGYASCNWPTNRDLVCIPRVFLSSSCLHAKQGDNSYKKYSLYRFSVCTRERVREQRLSRLYPVNSIYTSYNVQTHSYLILISSLLLGPWWKENLDDSWRNRKYLMLQTWVVSTFFPHWKLNHLTYLLFISLFWSVVMNFKSDQYIKYTFFYCHEMLSKLCRLSHLPSTIGIEIFPFFTRPLIWIHYLCVFYLSF